jgi:DNA-directed RNA polymerase subunit F
VVCDSTNENGRTVAISNNYWDEDEDNDTTEVQMDGSDAMKQLRKAKRADEKRIKELTEKLEAFDKAQRETVIKKVLETKGVSPKAARLIVRELDGDISEDSVSNWIDDNAEVFGLQVQQEEQPRNTIDRAALRQQDIVTQQAFTPDRADDALLRLNNASSAEEIIAMIQSGEFI